MGLFRRRNLSGAQVFITGAASGIGKATALAVAAKGGELFLTDVNDAAPFSNRGFEDQSTEPGASEEPEGDRGDASGRNLEQLDQVKGKP